MQVRSINLIRFFGLYLLISSMLIYNLNLFSRAEEGDTINDPIPITLGEYFGNITVQGESGDEDIVSFAVDEVSNFPNGAQCPHAAP